MRFLLDGNAIRDEGSNFVSPQQASFHAA